MEVLPPVAAARSLIADIDGILENLNGQRAEVGSYSNRLDSTVSNLTNISSNLQAGRGRIEDADFAAETTSLAKSQILTASFNSDAGAGQCLEAKRAEPAARLSASQKNKEKPAQAGFFRF